MIVSKDGRVWIRRGIPRVVFSFPSRGRGINNRTRERERESLPIIPRPALFYRGLGGRQLISGSTFRCTSIAISSFFCSITGQQMRYIYIFLAPFTSLFLISFSGSRTSIYISKTDSNSSGQLAWLQAITFLTWPFSLYLLLPKLTHEGLTKMADPHVNWNIIKRYCF